MKVLCVAEKPSIAKSITAILSSGQSSNRAGPAQYCRNYDFTYNLPPPLGRGQADFTVTSVLGHLTSSDFSDEYRKWHSCDPFSLFDIPIQTYVDSKLRGVERNLQQEARHADLLMIWTDCDREGEHIGSEIVAVCRKVNRRILVKRAKFSAIIPAQIHNACRNPVDLDELQAAAVEARISLDLRVGAAFTRFQTLALQARVPQLDKQVISYGPCQFPTLGFVVDQYERVKSFTPETFYFIEILHERDGNTTKFVWKRNHLFDLEAAVALYEPCVTVDPTATVRSMQTKPTSKWKPLPLTTVELQKSGSRLLRLAPKKILDTAEKLYQQGFLSYPRTETDQYDKDFDFTSLITKQTYNPAWSGFAQGLIDGGFERPRNGGKNDKAHPPIHPTANASNLMGDEKRVYEYVTRRFLASCSTNALGKLTTVEIEIAGEFFSTSGLVITARNYLDVFPYDMWSDSVVPDFTEGETFIPTACNLQEGQTSAPSLLTEADLVGLMDKNGIGTDATIAEHIARIIEREYVQATGSGATKYLTPSKLGIGLVEGYNKIGFDRSLTKPFLRRETEHRMQLICDGVETKADVVQFSIEQYKEVFVKARREMEKVIETVSQYMNSNDLDLAPVQPRQPNPRGGRGSRNNQNDDDDDGGDSGPAPPASRGRGGTRGARGTRGATRGRSTSGTSRKRKNEDDEGPSAPYQNLAPKRTTSENVKCACSLDAVERTVQRDGPNKGKKFFACSKPQGDEGNCNFFQWADVERSSTDTSNTYGTTRPAQRQRRDPPPPRPPSASVIRCNCRLEAVRRTVVKEGPTQGRAFWTCPNSQAARCGFFEWEDEQQGQGGGGGGGQGTRCENVAAGSTKQGGCFKCNQEGHWASECPNEDGNQQHQHSYNNGSSSSRGGRGGKATSRGRGRGR